MTLEATLKAFLIQPRLARLPKVLLVACSGGADSLALLRVAAIVGPGLGWRVEALHCDHGLRREAKADAAFVAALCAKLGLPLHAFATRLGRGAGMEARARVWRRRCYAQAAKAAGARLALLGQHAQDQAETLLLNLLRGAGPAGAAAMLPLTPMEGAAGVLLGRPWLGLEPEALRAWLKKKRQAWREDASNQDQALARNRVRHSVLPALRAINPKAVRHLTDYAASLADSKKNRDLAGLLHLDRAARRRAQAVLAAGQGQADLGRGWTLRVSRGAVQVQGAAMAAPGLPSALHLRVGPWQAWGAQWRFRLKLSVPSARKLQQDKAFYFDPHLVDEPLRVRVAKVGERLKPFGASPGSKLLRDLLAEAGVPLWQRAGWPVLEAGSQVLGMPGVRRGQGFKVVAGTKALCLQWQYSPAALAGQA